LIAATALAGAAVDLLSDPSLVAAARADFEMRRGKRPYTSLIPKEQKAPAKIR
jgi:aminobenzoyl-glutamate utilization protein B